MCGDCGRFCFPVFLMFNWKHVPASAWQHQSPERVMRGQPSGGRSLTLVSSSQFGKKERWPVPNSYSALIFTLPSKNNMADQLPSCQQKNTSGFVSFYLTVSWSLLWTTPLHIYLWGYNFQLLFPHRYITTICHDMNMNYRKQIISCLQHWPTLDTGQCESVWQMFEVVKQTEIF